MTKPHHKYVASRPLPVSNIPKLGPRRWAFHRPVHRRSTAGTLFRRLIFLTLTLLGLGAIAMLAYKLWVDTQTNSLIYAHNDSTLPHNHVALVLGAGLNRAGGPSAMLYDRVATAADLYDIGKVDKLLMSGDNSTVNYNEVEVMRQTALDLGVLYEDVILDYAGFNTWDSCYRAREVFSLTEVTIITQRFHLPRALHTCNHLNVTSVGVSADRQT
ncbi:MAG TPA: ElyC/SanA/YdcF family protein, partial [Chloroflexia bacterium]|nr:ElyC/SanA/YdcF family protein [Chloroflexia bacterium]